MFQLDINLEEQQPGDLNLRPVRRADRGVRILEASVELVQESRRFGRLLNESHRASSPCTGGMRGSSSTNEKRRRMAVSMRAMDLSAVFIVSMMNRFCGSVNSLSGEYCRLMEESRYSSRKYSSPNTLARFAR